MAKQQVEPVVKRVTLTLPGDRIAELKSALIARHIVGGLMPEDILQLIGAAVLMAIEKGVPIHIKSCQEVEGQSRQAASIRKTTTRETGEITE